MSSIRVEKLLDTAVCNISKKLISLDIKASNGDEVDKNKLLGNGFREVIETKGAVKMTIVYNFSEKLFLYITSAMNGGSMPAQEDINLYINEYINIISGHVISRINDETSTRSRISVPNFYKENDKIEKDLVISDAHIVTYESKYGTMQIMICKGE